MKRIFLALIALVIAGCTEDYLGPIRDKPVHTWTDQEGRLHVLTLGERLHFQNVPQKAKEQALDFFDANRGIIHNPHWLSIIDFNLHSSQPRLFVIDLDRGDTEQYLVAHGEGSDPKDTGYAHVFSDVPGSYTSSLGFYLIAEPYYGKWGLSARLDGLQKTNAHARERTIVLHGADYVSPDLPKPGRTQGCPAVELKWIETLVHRLAGDSLLYAYIEGM